MVVGSKNYLRENGSYLCNATRFLEVEKDIRRKVAGISRVPEGAGLLLIRKTEAKFRAAYEQVTGALERAAIIGWERELGFPRDYSYKIPPDLRPTQRVIEMVRAVGGGEDFSHTELEWLIEILSDYQRMYLVALEGSGRINLRDLI